MKRPLLRAQRSVPKTFDADRTSGGFQARHSTRPAITPVGFTSSHSFLRNAPRRLSALPAADGLEREADSIADTAMAASLPVPATEGAPVLSCIARPGALPPELTSTSVGEVTQRPGEPLPDALRMEMQRRLGCDFSSVRVHVDSLAAASAQELNADAYAVGHRLVFGPGNFAPTTPKGLRLVAHELTHVIQQVGADMTPEHGAFAASEPTSLLRRIEARRASAVHPDARRNRVRVQCQSASTASAALPRSYGETLDPDSLTDDALEAEIEALTRWLHANPHPDSWRAHFANTLAILTLARSHHASLSEERQTARERGILPPDLERIELAFGRGFLTGARRAIPADAYAGLVNGLADPENLEEFAVGIPLGVLMGSGQSLWDNATGILQLVGATFLLNMALPATPLLLAAGASHAYEERAEIMRICDEVIRSLRGLIEQLILDPAFLSIVGFEGGVEVGRSAGRWFVDGFLPMTPMEKGIRVGEAVGYLATEVALLFIGVEEVAAAARVLRGSTLGRRIFAIVRELPALRRLAHATQPVAGSARTARAHRITAGAEEAASAGSRGRALPQESSVGTRPELHTSTHAADPVSPRWPGQGPAELSQYTTASEYLAAIRSRQDRGPSGVGLTWDYDRFPQGIGRAQDWRPGDPIDMPDLAGSYPSYGTLGRGRYWRNRAHFELEDRAAQGIVQDTSSLDPMRRMSDHELRSLRDTASSRVRSPQDPTHRGRRMEIEHSGVQQRVVNWIRRVVRSDSTARRIAGVSDPTQLMEVTRLEHALLDAEAHRFGHIRADISGRTWVLSATADPRGARPLLFMRDEMIQELARFSDVDLSRSPQLLEALRVEVRERGLSAVLLPIESP